MDGFVLHIGAFRRVNPIAVLAMWLAIVLCRVQFIVPRFNYYLVLTTFFCRFIAFYCSHNNCARSFLRTQAYLHFLISICNAIPSNHRINIIWFRYYLLLAFGALVICGRPSFDDTIKLWLLLLLAMANETTVIRVLLLFVQCAKKEN